MTTVTLREYGAAQWVDASATERAGLEAASGAWKKSLGLPELPLVVLPDGNHVALSARHVAGTMRVGAINLEIAPKFLDADAAGNQDWRQAFWQILILAQQGRSLFGRAAGADTSSLSIADLLAEIFLASFARGSIRGMPVRYTEMSDTLTAVRGSFDHRRFADWVAEPWRIPTVETQLTADTPLARLLSWAASQLRTLVTSPGRARELDSVRHQVPGWNALVPTLDQAERLELGVQHEALRPALEVAILLLRGHGVRHGAGDRDVIGFLWKSEDIYERFLFWLCREAGRSRGLRVSKGAARFGISETAQPLTTTPDVAFSRQDGTVVAVLDAKYKTLNSKPKAGDSYQILTSANHFGCERVGLVYPSSAARNQTDWIVSSALGGRDVTISALHLDLLKAATTAGRRSLVDVVGAWLDSLGLPGTRPDLEIASA